MYKHQLEDFEFFKDRTEIPIFASVGTGKTRTIIAIACYKFLKKEIDSLLVITLNQLHTQWHQQEIPKWVTVPYQIQCFGGTGGAKVTYPFESDNTLQIVCTNIDTFSTKDKWRDIVNWANFRKTFIVIDEATIIKTPSAVRTQRIMYEFNNVVRKGKTILKTEKINPCRAIMTGTPVTNSPLDLWSPCEFLKPNFFGRNWYSFQAHFSMFTRLAVGDRVINVPLSEEMWVAIKKCTTFAEATSFSGCSEDTFNTIHAQDKYEGPYKHADELKAILDKVAKFHKIEDCIDMPEQTYITRDLIMPPELREVYDSMVEEYVAEYRDHRATALNKITALIRLQQISSGFIYDKDFIAPTADSDDDILSRLYGLVDNADVTPDDGIQWIGKSNPKLDMLYNDIEECDKPCIVITRFSAEAARIYEDLGSRYSTMLMTGWKRTGTIEEFQNNKFQIMVANLAVVSRGFNLQNSHNIFFYSNSFSLEMRLQAEGRIYRAGQKNICSYTDYEYADSVDNKIVASLLLKRSLLEYIRNTDMKEVVT
jgi:superfamily II DNA or RNA helicase